MIPKQLYIEDFYCHEKSVIDFTQFSSALIVGKIENSDLYSNGVGKTTIFKAIEYALFGAADVNLEKLIRDDCASCKVIFDFNLDDQLYRVCRIRTKKGTSDLSLFQRSSVEAEADQVNDPSINKDIWKDISGRRAPDTEKDLSKLLKINAKSFRNTVHFAQNDFTGLTTATPEKRKALLKETLSLSFYSKLEKMAKDKSSTIMKQIEKNESIIDNLNGSDEEIEKVKKDIIDQNNLLVSWNSQLASHKEKLSSLSEDLQKTNLSIQEITNENKFLISQKEKSLKEKSQIESSISDLTGKKTSLLEEAKSLSAELKSLKEKKELLESIDFSEIDVLNNEHDSLQSSLKEKQVNLQSLILKVQELKVPLPEGSECNHCRQNLTKEHLQNCKKQIANDILKIESGSTLIKEEILKINQEIKNVVNKVRILNGQSSELSLVLQKFFFKEKEIKDKKEVYNDYNKILEEYNNNLKLKNIEIEDLISKVQSSSLDKVAELNGKVNEITSFIASCNRDIASCSKQQSFLTSSIAVLEHSLNLIKDNLVKKQNIIENNKRLQEEYKFLPSVVEAFSSSGIPNLIIQNLLDELQDETNKLLNNLKPGLQLQFVVEKEKKNGISDETLDILYFVQGKSREYEQLSGAMKLSVNFSLKLGLSFLLQNMFDTKINLLLLDEIDQSLDKAGVDAFAEIVKFFQKDFTILVITHNDHLKNKFSSGILVEQDKNMVSKARVVSSW
jgi:exonuclease SbcC